MMTFDEKLCLLDEDTVIFTNYRYDDALIGTTDDGRAIYDYDLMIDWLMKETGWSEEDCVDWIDYNTARLANTTPDSPIILYRFIE